MGRRLVGGVCGRGPRGACRCGARRVQSALRSFDLLCGKPDCTGSDQNAQEKSSGEGNGQVTRGVVRARRGHGLCYAPADAPEKRRAFWI